MKETKVDAISYQQIFSQMVQKKKTTTLNSIQSFGNFEIVPQ